MVQQAEIPKNKKIEKTEEIKQKESRHVQNDIIKPKISDINPADLYIDKPYIPQQIAVPERTTAEHPDEINNEPENQQVISEQIKEI